MAKLQAGQLDDGYLRYWAKELGEAEPVAWHQQCAGTDFASHPPANRLLGRDDSPYAVASAGGYRFAARNPNLATSFVFALVGRPPFGVLNRPLTFSHLGKTNQCVE